MNTYSDPNANVYDLREYIQNNTQYRLLSHSQATNEPHSHRFLELAYVLDGEGNHVLNGTQSWLKPGDYVIIDYNSIHHYVCERDEHFFLIDCLFVPEFIDRSLAGCNSFKNIVSSYQIGINFDLLSFNPTEYVFHDDKGHIHQLLNIMIEEYNNPRVGSADIAKQCLSQILLMTLREIAVSSSEQTSNLVQYIMDACKNRYNEKKLLDSICKELHYSKPYVSTKFKKETGKPFKDFLLEIRLDTACKLLHTTNKRVSEIASLVGYNDVAFFISVFKSKINLTPIQFRNAVKAPLSMDAPKN